MDAVNNGAQRAKFQQGAILVGPDGTAIGSVSFYAGKFATFSEKGQANLLDAAKLVEFIKAGTIKLETRTERVASDADTSLD